MIVSLRLLPLLAILLLASPAMGQTGPAVARGWTPTFTASAEKVGCFDFFEVKVELPPAALNGGGKPLNPFTQITLSGTFTQKEAVKVEGFCDSANGSVLRVRFMPTKPGVWTYELHGAAGGQGFTYLGKFEALAGKRRGPLRVDAEHPWHFAWEGTKEHCYVNGTTAFFLLGWEDDKTITSILDRLHALEINRVRLLLDGRSDHTWTEPIKPTKDFHQYLNPWMAKQPEDIANPGFDYTRFNPAYWQKFERMLRHARDKDIVISTIFFWNDDNAHPKAGGEDERRYFQYAVNRLAAFSNIAWDLGDDLDSFRDEKWTHDTGTFLYGIDPYKHLATSHPVNNEHQDLKSEWFSHTSFQEWHRPLHGWMLEQRKKQAKTGRIIPQMDEEYGYEDHYPDWAPYKAPAANAEGDRRAAWEMAMAGCYQTTGETAKRGTGVAPDTGGGWINGRGDATMTMLNSYALMVKFFKALEWWKAEPHDELVNNGAMCLAAPDSFYVVYLPHGKSTTIKPLAGKYSLTWFNPRTGATTQAAAVPQGPEWTSPEGADKEDWVMLLRRAGEN